MNLPVPQPSRLRVRPASRRANITWAGRPSNSQAGTRALRPVAGSWSQCIRTNERRLTRNPVGRDRRARHLEIRGRPGDPPLPDGTIDRLANETLTATPNDIPVITIK